MPSSGPSPQVAAVQEWLGGKWYQDHIATRSDGSQVCVLQRDGAMRDVIVLRNDLAIEGSQKLIVPNVGAMCCHPFHEDPALPGLRGICREFGDIEVLRYRPGKRATLAARDGAGRPVIIKCLAKNSAAIFARLQSVYRQRSGLGFRVSEPLSLDEPDRIVVQSRLKGEPLQPRLISGRTEYGAAIATAVASLHRSEAEFPSCFTPREQQRRTRRYADLIRIRLPSLRQHVDLIMDMMERAQNALPDRQDALAPIHGSLHSNQWLFDDDGLALVDFDRAAMGHPELDFATFLAEWDYEPRHIALPIQKAFRNAMPPVDEELLNYYWAHKHFSKAFKAAKIPDAGIAARKVRRNLNHAAHMLAGAMK